MTLPYRLFDLTLSRREALSPAFARMTFAGPQVAAMATHAPDQRIKIFLPGPDGRSPALEHGPAWLAAFKAMDEATRPVMRTYTIRALRPEAVVVDIDFVLHGDSGPASAWAERAAPGDRVQITAPNRAYDGDPGGYEWKPPAGAERILLIADETAVPALAGILQDLAAGGRPPTQAFAEIPAAADRLPLPRWPGLNVTWLPREGRLGAVPGQLMVQAAQAVDLGLRAPARALALADIDVDREILWERADAAPPGLYGWVAGEAMAVRAIRRILIEERGLDRRALNLMGYWRLGRALD